MCSVQNHDRPIPHDAEEPDIKKSDGLDVWRYAVGTDRDANAGSKWREAMSRINLPVESIWRPELFRGSIISRESALGVRISVVEAEPQVIGGEYVNQTNAIWIAMLIEGEANLAFDGNVVDLAPGDVIYGARGAKQATLTYQTPYKHLFVSAPPPIIDPRLISPAARQLGVIRADTSAARIFSRMLFSLAGAFDEMQTSELRPIELSLAEFLISAILAESGETALGGAAAIKAAHVTRICQNLESYLGDPALDTKYAAAREGVSVRYLQKLFSSSGMTFGTYIRSRRLERCREDLVNPAYANASITEICFRWGFSSSAHFSRAFRDQFGMSPRELRKSLVNLGNGESAD